MRHSAARIIATHLIDLELFTAATAVPSTFPLYVGFMPDQEDATPDSAALYDTEGVKDGRLMRGGSNIVHPGIQLRVRSTVHDTGWSKIHEIEEEIASMLRTEITVWDDPLLTKYRVQNCSLTSPVIFLGLEEGPIRRYLFTANWLVTISQSEGD